MGEGIQGGKCGTLEGQAPEAGETVGVASGGSRTREPEFKSQPRRCLTAV